MPNVRASLSHRGRWHYRYSLKLSYSHDRNPCRGAVCALSDAICRCPCKVVPVHRVRCGRRRGDLLRCANLRDFQLVLVASAGSLCTTQARTGSAPSRLMTKREESVGALPLAFPRSVTISRLWALPIPADLEASSELPGVFNRLMSIGSGCTRLCGRVINLSCIRREIAYVSRPRAVAKARRRLFQTR